jgi:hypothetical protein
MGLYGPEGAPVTLVASGVRRQVSVTPTDGLAITKTNGLSCNTSGTVVFKDAAGNTATRYMEAGRDYPWEVTEVLSTGTTASMGINALYSQ